MSRGKMKQLLNLLDEANVIIDILYRDNKEFKKKNKELEESCENFAEVEENLHKKIADLENNKSNGIIKKITGLFS